MPTVFGGGLIPKPLRGTKHCSSTLCELLTSKARGLRRLLSLRPLSLRTAIIDFQLSLAAASIV